ncbi:MAG TPA: ABC transporter permease [Pseudonocardiaceae bacterium]
MGNAVKAEYRKIFSTKMWWALLIPAAVIAFVLDLAGAIVAGSRPANSGFTVPPTLLGLGVSFTFTAIFAAIFGSMAISGEFRHRVIGTTYLTSRSRGTVLGAKLLAYTGMGLVYGVVTLLSGTLGALAGDGSNALPSGATWPLVSLVEIVVIVLWTLLGVGFGGLISNQIAAVVVLLAYTLVGETVIGLLLNALHASSATFYLPSNAASDMVIRFAIDQLVNQGQPLTTVQQDLGAVGVPSWWVSGLVFVAYTAVFAGLGWAVNRRRDIT